MISKYRAEAANTMAATTAAEERAHYAEVKAEDSEEEAAKIEKTVAKTAQVRTRM
jgi:hypothetical protein